jgi:EmrB/QacA subfamily drug resistance transporter
MPDGVARQFARFGPAYRWYVSAAGISGVFAMIFSGTMVNVAVPDVMGTFGIGLDRAQWLSTAFIATMTAGQLLNAWLVAKLGARRAFMTALGVFTFGALCGAFSPNFTVVVIGRILQGFGAGVTQPLVMATLFRVFPTERRGMALGMYGMGVMMAPAFGPFIGGLAIDTFNWRYIFFVPMPFIAISFLAGSILMPGPDTSDRQAPRFDWLGFALLSTALVTLLWALASGQRLGWSSNTLVIAVIIGVVAAVSFIVVQRLSSAPLLNVSLFANPQFAAAAMIALVFGVGNFASSYLVPVFTQLVQGFTATRAGLVLMPASLMTMMLFPIAGRLADLVPRHLVIMGGLCAFAAGAFMLSGNDANTPFWAMALMIMLARAGMAFVNPSLNATALSVLPVEHLNQASGAINFVRQLGGACGINAAVVALEIRTQFHGDALTATQTAGNATSRAFLDQVRDLLNAAGVPEALHTSGALHYLGEVIHAQARMMAFQDTFLLLSLVFVAALIPAWVLGQWSRKR